MTTLAEIQSEIVTRLSVTPPSDAITPQVDSRLRFIEAIGDVDIAPGLPRDEWACVTIWGITSVKANNYSASINAANDVAINIRDYDFGGQGPTRLVEFKARPWDSEDQANVAYDFKFEVDTVLTKTTASNDPPTRYTINHVYLRLLPGGTHEELDGYTRLASV